MRVALYCPNKPLSHPNPSGDLIIAQGIQKALSDHGHECREVVSFRSRWFWKTPGGIAEAMKSLAMALRELSIFRPGLWLTYHTYYKSPDVIGPWASRFFGLAYAIFQPMYATKWRKNPETRAGFYLNRLAIKSSRLCFTNNLDDIEALQRLVEAHRMVYLPPGIFPEAFRRDETARHLVRSELGIPESTPLIATAARMRKGVKFESLAYLLGSLGTLGRRRGDFALLVAGDGPMEGEIRRMAEEALPGRVIFCGRVARERMFAYYSAADFFAFPGIGESLGMVYLEAQACGLPVVALNETGAPQVVNHNRTGFLVERDGGEAMAAAMERLINDPELRKSMGIEAAAYVLEERNLHHNYAELTTRLERISAG